MQNEKGTKVSPSPKFVFEILVRVCVREGLLFPFAAVAKNKISFN
jgi:hypothetical protein